MIHYISNANGRIKHKQVSRVSVVNTEERYEEELGVEYFDRVEGSKVPNEVLAKLVFKRNPPE